MRFTCGQCEEVHEGVPGFSWDHPIDYLMIPEEQRARRCHLTPDWCTIDEQSFFVRGCLEIPVHDESDPFIWGVWVSLSRESFEAFRNVFPEAKRSHIGPFFGWLRAHIRSYPETLNLKTRVRLRDEGTRPFIELEPTDHVLAVEQRKGIDRARVIELFEQMTFPKRRRETLE